MSGRAVSLVERFPLRSGLLMAFLVVCAGVVVLPAGPALAGAGEGRGAGGALDSRALAPGGPVPGAVFEPLPASRTGLDFVHRWTSSVRHERLLNSSMVGGGVCAGDYDGDGLPDLCLTRPAGGMRLYRNEGGLRFRDVTEQAGVREDGLWTTGATFADVDNDGWLDLYVCCYEGPNRLYRNRGDGTFREEATARGLDFNGASVMAAFADYDCDGRLDVYLLTAGLMPGPAQKFRVTFVGGRPEVPEELREYWQLFHLPGERAAMAEAGQRDRLYHNEGNGRFREVGQAAGIEGFDFGNAAVWWDPDSDGWPDLYVANDYFGPDRFYRNRRDGTFTNVALQALPSTPWTSMGADTADFNNDGLPDLIASDMSGTTRFKRLIDSGDLERSGWFLEWAEPRQYLRNALYLNTGTERFLEVAQMAGLAHTDWTWSIVCGDLDLDGREDVFVPNGMTRDWMDNDLAIQSRGLAPADFVQFWRRQPVRRDQNLVFRNLGGLQFTSTAPAWGLDHEGPSFGAVLTDLDADGRPDLVINDYEAPCRVYRNVASTGHRLAVRLRGTAANRFGLGATVRLETAAGVQTRFVTAAHGFMSATEPAALFGLGETERVNRLTIRWPGGREQVFEDLAVDRAWIVTEPDEGRAAPASHETRPTDFRPADRFVEAVHRPVVHDDFTTQPGLPWSLSTSSPCLLAADVGGAEGVAFFVGGSPQHPLGLFRRDAEGRYRRDAAALPAPEGSVVTAVFLEANGDGRTDLLVVDDRPGAALLLNQGDGSFRPAPAGSLPALDDPMQAIAAADLDRDGDLDVVLGGGSPAGRYPEPAPSRLWRNEGGVFHDATAVLAPALTGVGRVRGMLWSDVDDDGWVDLLLATEWGPVRLLRNQQGRLEERTAPAGLSRWTGWWSGIAAADIDGDADLDYVVGNLGTNTPYQPTPAEPCRLYLGPFAGEGVWQVLEATGPAASPVPLRGKSTFEKIVPSVAARFPTHHAYARATLAELVGADALAGSLLVEAVTAASGVLINDGRGRFEFRPLEWPAQVAPVWGVAAADFDGDTLTDVFLAQNLSSAWRETGRMNGGVGTLLRGTASGDLAAVPPVRSGIVIAGEARAVVAGDLTGDGWPDLVVALHGGEMRVFEGRASANRRLQVRLRGPAGNPDAVGARLRLTLEDGSRVVAETQAGSGHRSQWGGGVSFGLGGGEGASELEVRWPSGASTRVRDGLRAGTLDVRQP